MLNRLCIVVSNNAYNGELVCVWGRGVVPPPFPLPRHISQLISVVISVVASIKDVQATREAFSPQKRTSSTLKNEIY